MITRREFLKNLGATLGIAAATPYVFDMGANLYRPSHEIIYEAFDWGDQHGMAMMFKWREETYRHAVRIHTPDRYLTHKLGLTAGEKALGMHALLDWKEDKIRRLMLK